MRRALREPHYLLVYLLSICLSLGTGLVFYGVYSSKATDAERTARRSVISHLNAFIYESCRAGNKTTLPRFNRGQNAVRSFIVAAAMRSEKRAKHEPNKALARADLRGARVNRRYAAEVVDIPLSKCKRNTFKNP